MSECHRTVLDAITADRLAKLCGLFSSHHDGERAAAAAMADKLVRALGLTWRDVVLPRSSEPQRPKICSAWVEPRTVRESISVALAHLDRLTPWERRFVLGVRDMMHHSTKQRMALANIIEKLRDLHFGAAA